MSIRDKLEKDKTYLRSKKILKRLQQSNDVDSVIDEIMSLHVSRTTANLKSKKFLESAVKTMIDSSISETASRSRVTAIKLSTLRDKLTLEETLSHLQKYMISKYRDYLTKEGMKTVTAQRAYLDVYLKSFLEFDTNLNYVLKMCDILIEDIDSAGWSLKRIGETLEQVSKDR